MNNLRDRLCVVQLSNGDGNAHVVHFPKKEYNCPNLIKLLSNKDVTFLFHFARFDVSIIEHYLGVKFTNIYCTKIASRLCRTYTDQHGLRELCHEFLSVKISKAQQSSNWGATKLTEEQINYAAGDVLYLHDLRKKLDPMLESVDRIDIAKRFPAAVACSLPLSVSLT